MTTARQIITTALTLHLNRLSPGETLNDDLAASCLLGLNDIVDEWSGQASFLWRDLLSSATVTGITATLGTTWADISPGQEIQGATYNSGSGDFPLESLSMAQYHEQVRIKSLSGGLPRFYAHDGASTIYFYPQCTGQTITLRTHQSMSDFADLDTAYVMPQGYRAALSAVLAERMAPSVLGAIPPTVLKASQAARSRIGAQAAEPAIINGAAPAGNILTGWR